jgi:hypothetical protein
MRIDQFRGLFFDAKKVIDATTKAERKVLSRFGAFVRRSARSSIRKRRKVSSPGQPPSSHTGLLRRFIFFAYDPWRKSVVIGPARLNQKVGDAPRALEHGGRSRVTAGRRRRRRVVRTVTIGARPFMGPAFDKEKPKLSAMWRDSIRA